MNKLCIVLLISVIVIGSLFCSGCSVKRTYGESDKGVSCKSDNDCKEGLECCDFCEICETSAHISACADLRG